VGPVVEDFRATPSGNVPDQVGSDLVTTGGIVPAITFTATGLYDGEANRFNFVQTETNLDNLQTNVYHGAAAIQSNSDPTNISFYTLQWASGAPNATLIDTDRVDKPFYPLAKSPDFSGDEVTMTSNDSPGILDISKLGLVPPTGSTTHMDFSFNFRRYVVWQYADGSIYTLMETDWKVEFAGTINSSGEFTPDPAHNIVTVTVPPFPTNNDLDPAILGGDMANDIDLVFRSVP
jgi:hypothetical protein